MSPARAQFRDTVVTLSASGTLVVPPSGANVAVYDVGTSNPISQPIYADATSNSLLPNPIPVTPQGEVNFWLADERMFDIWTTIPGYQSVRKTSTADAATGSNIDGGVFVNPTFVGSVGGTPSWLNPQSITISQPSQPLIDHNSLGNVGVGNPHPQYQLAGAAVGVDAALRTYVQKIMSVLDPGGAPPPPP